MRRLVLLAVFAAGMFLAVREIAERAGPAMWERCSEMCVRMLANMPESFPPNRMMADLEALKEQTVRILEVLAGRMARDYMRILSAPRRTERYTPADSGRGVRMNEVIKVKDRFYILATWLTKPPESSSTAKRSPCSTVHGDKSWWINARRNGRAFSSHAARGGGLPLELASEPRRSK